MRILPILLSSLSLLPLLSPALKAQTGGGSAPTPSGFDSTAKAPANLPAKLNIPPNTRIEVTASTPGINPAAPPDPTNIGLLFNPCLLSAVIESDQKNAHAVFQWEGRRSSEAFLINNECFRSICLAYPQTIATTGPALNFSLGSIEQAEGSGVSFPGVTWYSPSTFVGTAQVNGSNVLVFSPIEKKPKDNKQPGAETYPEGPSVCLDSQTLLPVWLTNGKSVFGFTYTPDHNVQINPQGYYLKAIERKFGHWP
jgi:hypothetical protein